MQSLARSAVLFQSTPPARGATLRRRSRCRRGSRFNPRPPRGGRPKIIRKAMLDKLFQSTPPARGATPTARPSGMFALFQSTPPARGATIRERACGAPTPVSIHAPRAGGDASNAGKTTACSMFQSTPPARGATLSGDAQDGIRTRFNPRPPRGGRPHARPRCAVPTSFNPRPPRGGRRLIRSHPQGQRLFQSTPPARGATSGSGSVAPHSIGFNPRPPRGGRPEQAAVDARRAAVSIHAPRAGGDLSRRAGTPRDCFNPRPPRGGRRGSTRRRSCGRCFNPRPPRGGRPRRRYAAIRSIHAPRAGGDLDDLVSIHAPRAGGDAGVPVVAACIPTFQSTPPARGATCHAGAQ